MFVAICHVVFPSVNAGTIDHATQMRNNSLRCNINHATNIARPRDRVPGEDVIQAMADNTNDTKAEPITIKKYANRRLYNTSTSSYVTLDHLAEMVKEGVEFAVFDAKTGEEITRSVLTHIIVEQEGKGQSLLPVSFLRHLISFYGDSLEAVVPKYLEQSMHSFADNQDQMRDYLKDAFGGLTPFSAFEEMGKQNVTMFESAMKMFTPFYPDGQGGNSAGAAPQSPNGKGAAKASSTQQPPAEDNEIAALRAQLEAMQSRLDKMSDI